MRQRARYVRGEVDKAPEALHSYPGQTTKHCQVDNRQVGTDYIADWLEARLR